jgi:cytochrome c-type biogenesis protein CcsB
MRERASFVGLVLFLLAAVTAMPRPAMAQGGSGPAAGAASAAPDASAASDAARPFHELVDLRPLDRVAVFTEGRLKSFASFASAQMQFVTGPRKVAGQGPDFTYLDLMIRPGAYADADVIYVKNKEVRARIAQAAAKADPSLAERLRAFEKSGLVSQRVLELAPVRSELKAMEGDLIRTAKEMDAMKGALAVKDPQQLLSALRLIPPADGAPDRPWASVGDIMLLGADPSQLPPNLRDRPVEPIPGIDEARQRALAADWRALVIAWQQGDAAAVNARVQAVADALPALVPSIYPSKERLEWEGWYFRSGNLSRTWLVFLAATVLLLLALVYRWPWALKAGMVTFGIAAGMQTFAVMLRWYISGRWPNSNMFEAVTTAAWMGTALALVAEAWFLRRTAMRGIVALGAAVTSMVALMAAYLLPVQLNPNISNMMPVLHDVWLYIHTNVIIFSYALIFMAAVSAGAYLCWRLAGGGLAHARVGGAGAVAELAAAGGGEGGGAVPGGPGRASVGEVLDGVTMLLTEVSFVMLWAGIVMGAIWADHSWGRPWGWDPKEVFALNTFVIFALLIHVRWKVRDKGLWTAILAVAGAAVMLFNWIVINFVISGLHSYA